MPAARRGQVPLLLLALLLVVLLLALVVLLLLGVKVVVVVVVLLLLLLLLAAGARTGVGVAALKLGTHLANLSMGRGGWQRKGPNLITAQRLPWRSIIKQRAPAGMPSLGAACQVVHLSSRRRGGPP
jgi:hypothetical protein